MNNIHCKRYNNAANLNFKLFYVFTIFYFLNSIFSIIIQYIFGYELLLLWMQHSRLLERPPQLTCKRGVITQKSSVSVCLEAYEVSILSRFLKGIFHLFLICFSQSIKLRIFFFWRNRTLLALFVIFIGAHHWYQFLG